MSIIWIDGFDLYNTTTTSLGARYTTTGSPSFTAGRFAGNCLQWSANAGFSMDWSFTATDTMTLGCAFQVPSGVISSAGAGGILFQFRASTTVIANISITNTGKIQFCQGSSGSANILATSGTTLIGAATWHYLEVAWTRNATTGSVNIYIDGILVGSASGVNTGASSIDNVNLPDIAGSGTMKYDDLYFKNDTTALGDSRVDVLYPAADTAQKQWTPDTGTANFSRVNSTTYDNDTTYVADATVGDKDLYTVGSLPSTPASIFAVQTTMCARKDDATTRQIRANLKSGVTTHNGPAVTMAATYAVSTDIMATDPNTSAAWTPTNVNAIQIGPEVVT